LICPNCGASGRGTKKVFSTRHSHGGTVTRQIKCRSCNYLYFTSEFVIDRMLVNCRGGHYHASSTMIDAVSATLREHGLEQDDA
jgi:transcriptional regulator NrdR family protein